MNSLSKEKSPYLLQHQNNPVNWYPWGEEAFGLARSQNKPIFLSIGYSTCYWCHVMEKDSFEHDDVAEVLNKDYICIKVDREERPDVDQIYMDVVIGLTGHGGWPMSMFLTPDLKPFWGGTFFYKKQFISILEQIAAAWTEKKESILETAATITQRLSQYLNPKSDELLPKEVIPGVASIFLEHFDSTYGGFGSAPKFPPSMQLTFLMRSYLEEKNPEILNAICFTLDCMAKGGIYDQIHGGFHRYATDEKWLIPHFEKMLYDNALLTECYLEAFQLTKNADYLNIAKETLSYLSKEMRSSNGGFFAAEDAGEVDKEGEFYVWTAEEVKSILSENELAEVRRTLSFSENGNFEHHTNILAMPFSLPLSARNSETLKSAKAKLLNARNKRSRPHRDEKIITSWCSLAISAYAKAFQITGEKDYLDQALAASSFIQNSLFSDGVLYRHFCNGRCEIPAFLEDYSFYIKALLDLYQSDFDSTHWQLASQLQTIQDKLFWDSENGGYFPSSARELFIKKKDFKDNALPSGNSIAFINLLTLENLATSEDRRSKIESLLKSFAPLVGSYPTSHPKFLHGLQHYFAKDRQLVIVSENKDFEDLFKVKQSFAPYTLCLLKSTLDSGPQPEILKDKLMTEGLKTYYECEGRACKLPAHELPTAKT